MTNTPDGDGLCTKCGQPSQKVSSGRLTQWIQVCSCEAYGQNKDVEPVNFCEICGKRVTTGRPGSFTQWIFSADACSCHDTFPTRGAMSRPAPVPNDLVSSEDLAEPKNDSFENFPSDRFPSDRFPSDRFEVRREIGRGATGTVYECLDKVLQRSVAIKTLNHVGRDALLSFQEEARATSKLNHPNVIQIVDLGVGECGAPYMVLELFGGESLDRYLRQSGPLTVPQAFEILSKVCAGLIAAHKERILHRDIKPSNILIGVVNGEYAVKLIDFGVAAWNQTDTSGHVFTGGKTGKTLAGDSSPLSKPRMLVGTPAYMSPDEALGRSFDARSDVYSLGCVLFEMLTGRPPFLCESVFETIAMHCRTKPPSFSRVRRSLNGLDPAHIEIAEAIISRCLQKDAGARYQSVEDLHRALKLEPVAVQSPLNIEIPALPETVVATREVKLLYTAAGVMALLLAVGFSYLILSTANEPSSFASLDAASKTLKKSEFIKRSDRGQAFYMFVRGSRWFIVIGNDRFAVQALESARSKNLWLEVPASDDLLITLASLCPNGLVFDGTEFTNSQIESISGISSIRILAFLNSKINDENLKQLARMTRLRNLAVHTPRMTLEGLRALAQLPNLRGISLTGMKQLDDRAVDILLTIPKFDSVSIGGTGITSSGAVRLIESGRLRGISLGSMPLDAPLFESLNRSGVEKLSLMTSTITPDLIDKLSRLKNLTGIDLRRCHPVNQEIVDKLLQSRIKNGCKECEILVGEGRVSHDWDIMWGSQELNRILAN